MFRMPFDTPIYSIEFETAPKKLGNSAYILVPKSFLGKKIRVRIQLSGDDREIPITIA